MVGVVAGAGLGLVVSVAIWWVQYRVLVPSIVFADGISKLGDDDGVVYRFKVVNQSRRRAIIDIHLDAILVLGKGVVRYRETALTNTSQSLKVEIMGGELIRLQAGGNRIRRFDLRYANWLGVNPRLLSAVDIDPTAAGEVALEQLLAATEPAFLQIRVLAYDEVSGSRKYFEPPRYRLQDIRSGGFRGMTVPAQQATEREPMRSSSRTDEPR